MLIVHKETTYFKFIAEICLYIQIFKNLKPLEHKSAFNWKQNPLKLCHKVLNLSHFYFTRLVWKEAPQMAIF